ncbi:MAG: thiamine pyrophosphate-binding protein, partial [Spirochaetales bacterium]
MAKITGAQITVRLLEQQGIKVVAGIPGGSTLPLYDELAKSSLKHILVRHEQAAGFFAQGISRTKDEVGVCLATSGPGAMNLLTAIADARADSIALVAITGQVNSSLIGTDAFQEADTFGLSFPITKHSILVKSAEELISAIPLAFTIARSGRKGPVLIDIPRDVQLQSVDIELPSDIDTSSKLCTKYATSEEDFAEKIAKTAELIQKRSDVVLYIGGGCNNPETAFAVKAFLDVCPMPTVTSLMGIGCIPFDHPCNCGMIGMHGTMTANRVMHDADLVLAIGTRFDDRATGLIAKFCPKATIVHVDVDAAEVNKIFSADIAIVGEAQGFFTALTKTVQKQGIKGVDITEYTKLRRAEF